MTRPLDLTVEEVQKAYDRALLSRGCFWPNLAEQINALIESRRQAAAPESTP